MSSSSTPELGAPTAEAALGEGRGGGSRGGGWITAALAAPGLIWIGFYLLAPLVIIVLVSFWTWTDAGFDKSFTTANYSELFHDSTYWDNMLSTFITSVIAPEGGAFGEAGAKTWHVVPGTTPKVGEGTAKTFTYTVEVEDGIDTTSFGGDEGFAQMVTETLSNPKSWIHNPQFAFERVDETGCGQAGFPGVADVADDGARGVWLRDSAGVVLLQPGLRARRCSRGCSSTRRAGCAARCRSRGISAPTASIWSITRWATRSAISITSRVTTTAAWRR